MEALIRWRSPARGVVQPDDFIPLLEETGLIVRGRRWVLREACRQGAAWRRDGHRDRHGRQRLRAPARHRRVRRPTCATRSRRAASSPSALTLEITETTLMRNADETARRLVALKELGVRIAIDDFGTGYSSLAYLQQFPVDALKIDRSFISRVSQDPEGRDPDPHARPARQVALDRDARRGHRAVARAVAAEGGALRQRPGLPVRPAARSRRLRGVPAGLDRRPERLDGRCASADVDGSIDRACARPPRICADDVRVSTADLPPSA